MNRILPYGGRAILDVRLGGNRPTDLVVLSIIGWRVEGINNPMCWINLGQHPSNFSFGFLRNLDVDILASTARPFIDVLATVRLLSHVAQAIYVSYPEREVTVPVQLNTGTLCVQCPTSNMNSPQSRQSAHELRMKLVSCLTPKMVAAAA